MYKVIIIDDNKLTADALAAIPVWEQYQCRICAVCYDSLSGKDAIEKELPDIILTDIKMPGYDGLDIIDMVRDSLSDVAVIFMSAYDSFSYVHRALKLGAYDYLLKPFGMEELETAVQKTILYLDKTEKSSGIEQAEVETQEQISENNQDALIQPIINYISERLDKHITAEDTAEAFYMSTSRLDKLINQYCGGGFRELRISLRINKAKELLLDVRFSVEEVAMKVGYKNYASFYRAFTRECGISPTEYRNPMSKQNPYCMKELADEDP